MLKGRAAGQPDADGWLALQQGQWAEARDAFLAQLRQRRSAETYEGLGWAGYGLDDAALTFDAREQAFRLYRSEARPSDAARVAAWLAADHLEFRGEPAVASGWLQRARRLLDGTDPGPDRGWLAVHEGAISLGMEGNTEVARLRGAEGAEAGRTYGVCELEMVGMGLEGVSMVNQGLVAEGMQLLDEASAIALSGEARILVCVGWACCYLIYACEYVRDYDRAGQWCDRVTEFCRRYDIAPLLGVCRTHYAAVLTWQGAWPAAEVELAQATETLAAVRPPLAGDGVVRLAELRRRQGRIDEARQLLAQAEGHPAQLLVGAAVALEQNDAEEAADLAERYLRGLPSQNLVERAAALEILLRGQLAGGRTSEAATTSREIAKIADLVQTPPLRAAAAAAEGLALGAIGQQQEARRRLEDAVDLYLRSQAPYETAETRLALAKILHEGGRGTAARREAEKAIATLEPLHASSALERARALQAEFETPVPRAKSSLTPRELQVLRLIANGMTNRDIAQELVLSDHTVHRHVNNALAKLGVSSRAAAVAQAASEGLLESRTD